VVVVVFGGVGVFFGFGEVFDGDEFV